MPIKIAVCQMPDIRKNIAASLRCIKKLTKEAEHKNVSLICFPECFLQGYLTDDAIAKMNAVNLANKKFEAILKQLSIFKPMIAFGLIEEERGSLFNTAVVVKDGRLIGKYRRTHLLDGESVFTAGIDYPVFEIDGLIFGINICCDTQYRDASAALTTRFKCCSLFIEYNDES